MARMARVVLPGYAHHVMQAGVRGLPIFSTDDDRRTYLALLAEMGGRFGVEVIAYCLMDTYIQAVVVPQTAAALARAIGEAHRRYTTLFNSRQGVRGFLFQGRFSSCPLDDEHRAIAARCVEREPVRAGLVERAWEYPWSSAAFHAGLATDDPLVRRRHVGDPTLDWCDLLDREPPEIERLRARARTGRPCGCDTFIEQAERLAQRRLRPRPAGRPRKHRELPRAAATEDPDA